MTAKEFFNTVELMRRHQRDYTRSGGRDRQAERYAKEAETIIDREIARVRMIERDRQQLRLEL